MILNNFKRLMATYMFWSGDSNFNLPIVGGKFKSTRDDEYKQTYVSYHSNVTNISSAYNGVKSQTVGGMNSSSDIVFGSGTTPVTANDCMIEKEIYQNIGYLVQSISKTISGDTGKTVITKVMKNNTGKSITISEIGLVAQVSSGTGDTALNVPVLLIREILDNPLTVPNGEVFSLEIAFNIPVQ